jgi:hypothetical protein
MLEQIVRGLSETHRYAVGLVDEGIYRCVNVPVNALELRGFSREQCALSLMRGSFLLGLGTLARNGFREMWSFWPGAESAYDALAVSASALKTITYSLIFGIAAILDKASISVAAESARSDGAATTPYLSAMRTLRPYVLAVSGAAAYRLLSGDESPCDQYCAYALPWALSLYVRDSSGPGIWSRIKENIRNYQKAALPAPAA